jgi:predicted ATPase
MLTRFEVCNYKSIKKLHLDMRPFMVLVGPNGAGKTNIVQALQLFGDILARRTTAAAEELGWSQIVHRQKRAARGGIRFSATFTLPRRALLQRASKLNNEVGEITVEISLVLKGSLAGHEITVESEELRVGGTNGLHIDRRDDNAEIEFGDDADIWTAFHGEWFESAVEGKRKFSSAVSEDPQSLVLPRTLPLREIDAQSVTRRFRLDTSALRSDARHESTRNIIGTNGEGLPVAVDRLRGRGTQVPKSFLPTLSALREVYPRIEDVVPESFAQGRVTLLFKERGIADPIPLDGVSDGVLHALALLMVLEKPGRGVVAIEEPENALHPWSVRKVLDHAQLGSNQRVLMTTHSETVVNAVKDPESLFIVEGDEEDGTSITPATSKEKALKAILAESGQQLGDIWLDGTLGGVPT